MAQAKKDLGTKLTCQSCGAKFYDLKKKTPVCPKCDEEYVVVKPRTRRSAVKAAPEPVKAAPVAVETPATDTPANDDAVATTDDVLLEVEVEVEDDDDDDSLIEDTSDIGGDEDDVAEVIVNIDIADGAKET